MNKKLFILLLLLIANLLPIFSFELVDNTVFKYKNGIIYAIKNENKNTICVLFSNSTDGARILYYDLKYTGETDYKNLLINLQSAQKRYFNQNSPIQKIQENLLLNIDEYKKCPDSICNTTNNILQNHYNSRFLKLSVDDSIETFVPNYRIRQYIKQVKKDVKSVLTKNMPNYSNSAIISFQINTYNGQVENLTIVHNGKLKKSDEKKYIKIINKLAPFKVPKDFKNVYDVINIKIKLDWKINTFY